MPDFYIGQKVVYIGGVPIIPRPTRRDVGDMLVRGRVYEVRKIGMYTFAAVAGPEEQRACWLVGVHRNTQHSSDLRDINLDVPYGQVLFRPVEEIMQEAGIGVKHDISIFKKIAQDVTDGKVTEITDA